MHVDETSEKKDLKRTMIYMGDEIQLGQTEVCGDSKPSVVIGHGHGNHGHGHTLTTHNHHQHQHGVLVNTMQNYGNNMLETFKTEQLCQVQCIDCQKYFNSEELMIAHRLIRHSTNNTNSTASNAGKGVGTASEKTYECDVCMKTFNKHSSWWKHKKCHTGERAYKCYICEKAFSQQANLQRHMFVHSGEKPHACKICDKRFSQAANLVKHQVIHTNEKPFACPICPKNFTQRANLKKHEMVHTGERPFLCPICKKGYTQFSNMRKHMLVHAKSKQTVAYLCAKCKVLFDTITVYDEHLESCKNSNENYNFDEVLEKLANTAHQSKDINTSSNAASGQQTASIIVVTAAIASNAPSSLTYSTSNRSAHTSTTMSASSLAGPSSSTMTEVTGVATIQLPSSNLKMIKYPRMGHQSII